ncbi:MAG: amino acid ABC transporter ATP-binding protein [Erysipelotrichaceae bacterium]|nr:amino acid ABC transporter ATP-binding protein [Erysipelotrichaceae bacterium]
MEVISVKDVKKSFDHLDVLKGISFTVNEGEVVCLIGPSGSGKSTMLRCINLLEDIDSGVITVLGEDISKLSDINAFRSKVGMVFQQFNLFNNMNVLDNCIIAQKRVLKTPVEEAKKKASMEAFYSTRFKNCLVRSLEG